VTVHNLLVAQGVVTAPKRAVKMAKVVVAPAAEKPVEAAPAQEVKAETTPEAEASPSESAAESAA
jgi:hypothetical protein